MWKEEDAVAITKEGAAVGTVVLLEPGIADSDASLGLNGPVATEHPTVAVLATQRNEVALQTFVPDILIKAEGELEVADVEMAVDGVHLEVAGAAVDQRVTHHAIGTVGTVAVDAERVVLQAVVAAPSKAEEEMAQLLVVLGTGVQIPGMQTGTELHAPDRVDPHLSTQVGRKGSVISEIGTHRS